MTRQYMTWNGLKQLAINQPKNLKDVLYDHEDETLYAFTLHEVFHEEGEFRQTRSSPNWMGDVVTMATCKQQMRCFLPRSEWVGVWNAMFCPSHCGNNALLFVGRVQEAFASNYDYGVWMKVNHPDVYQIKRASGHPQGDIYTPRRPLDGEQRYDPKNFITPPGHTRSVEKYKDGTPKWWKDIRYKLYDRRPPVFLFDTGLSFLFRKPMLWHRVKLGRAVRRTTVGEFLEGLHCG